MIGNGAGPHFVGIGAQRSGTSWLYRNLGACAGVWLPPVKELHYFDEIRGRPLFNERYRKHRGIVLTRYRRALAERDFRGLTPAWDFHFLVRLPNDRWYRRLFWPRGGRICGEITPAYGTLEEATVEQIGRLLPQLRIVFLMRDPVERSWSQARKDLPRVLGRPIERVAVEDLLSWFDGPWCQLRSNYLRTLRIWQNVFGPHALHVEYYESIRQEPEALVGRVKEFLGVTDADHVISGTTHTVVNRGREAPMPAAFRRHAARSFLPMLEQLALEFGGFPEAWWARNEAIAAGREPVLS